MTGNSDILIQDKVSAQIINAARELVTLHGTDYVTVSDILRKLNITNRVFYNRFHNIEEVFKILYQEMIYTIRQSLKEGGEDKDNFFERVQNIAVQTLIFSYEKKKSFSRYVFEADSSSDTNFIWWSNEIQKLISQGKRQGLLRGDLDNESISYSIWCFIRGFNADALARNLSRSEALRHFNLGFETFLRGMRA